MISSNSDGKISQGIFAFFISFLVCLKLLQKSVNIIYPSNMEVYNKVLEEKKTDTKRKETDITVKNKPIYIL